jgi:hypothetical protein
VGCRYQRLKTSAPPIEYTILAERL